MAIPRGFSISEGPASHTAIIQADTPLVTPLALAQLESAVFTPLLFSTQRTVLIFLSLFFLHRALVSSGIWKSASGTKQQLKRPTQIPYLTALTGNLVSFLYAPQDVAQYISEKLGKSGIFNLNLIKQDVLVVSGAEYINAIWKDSARTLMSHDALCLSLSNMFGVPMREMPFFTSDRTGSYHHAHPEAPARDADKRVTHLMFKITAEHLSGAHLRSTAEKYQASMQKRIASLPIENDWVEMDDLFTFTRRLIAESTIQTMLGSKFLSQNPGFVDDFYTYNDRIRRFLLGWPRFMLPNAWSARGRYIAALQKWRLTFDASEFDGSPMMPERWTVFEKWNITDEAVAAQDLGILWGTFSNAIILAFWLVRQTLQDRQLLANATAEVNNCLERGPNGSMFLDTTKLTSQPLLQSMQAETLRKYVAVYIPRVTEYGATQLLDYHIPKNQLMVINSAMAHMDERNWNLGSQGEHPVRQFWAERFLTQSKQASAEAGHSDSTSVESKPTFSISQYKGAWIPFGGGIHQCPARHWVKNQMLISLVMITGSFEIELLDKQGDLRIDQSKYGLGALNPGEKSRFRIRRR